MEKKRFSKKLVIVPAIIVVCMIILSPLLNGINTMPFRYRNGPVSFLTPDLKWGG